MLTVSTACDLPTQLEAQLKASEEDRRRLQERIHDLEQKVSLPARMDVDGVPFSKRCFIRSSEVVPDNAARGIRQDLSIAASFVRRLFPHIQWW